MCFFILSTHSAEKGPRGPHRASGREGRVVPAVSRAGHTGAFHTHGYRNLHSYLHSCVAAGSSAAAHTSVSVCAHTMQWCSLNRSYVIHCDAWTYCLELLWQKGCGITVWDLLWPPASGSPIETGPRWKLCRLTLAQGTDHLLTWTLDRFDLFCCQSSVAEGR